MKTVLSLSFLLVSALAHAAILSNDDPQTWRYRFDCPASAHADASTRSAPISPGEKLFLPWVPGCKIVLQDRDDNPLGRRQAVARYTLCGVKGGKLSCR